MIDPDDDLSDSRLGDPRRREQPLAVTVVHWSDRVGRSWRVEMSWRKINDRAEPVALRIATDPRSAKQPIERVTKALLRELPLADLERRSRRQVQDLRTVSESASDDAVVETMAGTKTMRQLRQEAKYFGARRGVALGPEGLAAVAAVYRAAQRDGKPVQAEVAKAFSVAKGTAANRILEARRAGLLPPVNRRGR